MSNFEQNAAASTLVTQRDDLAAVRDSHEDLRELTEDNLAEYTSLLVVYQRAVESKRGDDAIINDSLAELFAGEAGKAIFEFFDKWFSPNTTLTNYVALRTHSIDETVQSRNPAVRQVVIVGAGLDSRAFRLESLTGCRVFEVDGSKSMMERKLRLVRDHNLKPLASEYHVIVSDLENDVWRAELLAKGFNPKEPTFWIVEGLLYYLSRDANVRLMKLINELSAPASEMWADMGGFTLEKNDSVEKREDVFRSSTMRYGEKDPAHGILSLLEWKMEMLAALDKPCELFGRAWSPMVVDSKKKRGEKEVVPWFFFKAVKPSAGLA